jgi:integrase
LERTQLVYFSLVGGGDGKNALRSRCVEVCVDGGSLAYLTGQRPADVLKLMWANVRDGDTAHRPPLSIPVVLTY